MPKNTAHLANDSVQGLVERVTYHNEENGFAVIKVKSRGKKDLVTVIGNIASISPGEWLVAEGSWIRDRDHGLQLKCVRIQTSAPSSLEGIEKYLGSGMVKGIGPIYAKKMVEKNEKTLKKWHPAFKHLYCRNKKFVGKCHPTPRNSYCRI